MGSLYSVDRTTGLEYWTGLLDSTLSQNTSLNGHFSAVSGPRHPFVCPEKMITDLINAGIIFKIIGMLKC